MDHLVIPTRLGGLNVEESEKGKSEAGFEVH